MLVPTVIADGVVDTDANTCDPFPVIETKDKSLKLMLSAVTKFQSNATTSFAFTVTVCFMADPLYRTPVDKFDISVFVTPQKLATSLRLEAPVTINPCFTPSAGIIFPNTPSIEAVPILDQVGANVPFSKVVTVFIVPPVTSTVADPSLKP